MRAVSKIERTLKLLDYFKGMPGEYDALKGCLLIDTPVVNPDGKRPFGGLFERILLADRMDEINKEMCKV